MPGTANRYLGWALLVIGFAWAAWLDPWTLAETDGSRLVGSARAAARHAQAVVLGIGFLQLLVAQVLSHAGLHSAPARTAALITGVGSGVYAAGYVLVVGSPWAAW